MKLLQKAVPEVAYLKAGLLGFGGSGKTRTASEIAIGLAKEYGGGKPVAFFDTETGSDYVLPLFGKHGVDLVRVKTQAFSDLIEFMKEAEAECSVAIIDSISHVWKELQESYKRKKKIKDLQFQDWGPLKLEWAQFTEAYVNSALHVVLCGRAAYEYDFEISDRGKRELLKTGVKMRAESELGFEPSLLLEMERLASDDLHGLIHRCHVLKDRTDTMHGGPYDNPTYETFRPFISALNIGGSHRGVDTSRTSEGMFDGPDYSRHEYRQRVDILIEKIDDALARAGLKGTSAAATKRRHEVVVEAFGTGSRTELERKTHPDKLEAGLMRLNELLGLSKPEPDDSEQLPASFTGDAPPTVAESDPEPVE